ncbi:maleylpyruvate isomerase family mycothiol-dependent enzyme [Nocardia sp. NBC_00565]|uniref:maleylpyruvate isomerase family mycothiol-dependent enzyme n=1 Tax=Nocardia sp. NBC_00565 TaxID=2975993 RepID=UPI002E8033C0|nr:maleylpyruvate isomerase family mycothiol-dependent enzyme [Nocardia sp. NBC_00565]WUC03086.1 maleylpyruvate isomerase family mycothiol-dependent enzyme [Nocardia sp. NBC_00565]
MTDPTVDRTELTGLLSQQWDAIAALVADLDEERWRTPSPLPGWSLFDVLAHVVGTESWLLGEIPPAHDPIRPKTDVKALPHVRNETGVLNEIWVDRLRPLSGKRLLELYREVTDRRREALASFGDTEWQAETVSPIGKVSYGRFMRVRLFDCWMHELDLADGLGVSVDEGGPRAERAFAELVPSIGRSVAKGAQAPDGSRITFELTGPLTMTLHVAVDGRANIVDVLDAPATVMVGMNSGLFTRLRGGRTTADEHAGEFTISGDTELGNRLVRNLAFTI